MTSEAKSTPQADAETSLDVESAADADAEAENGNPDAQTADIVPQAERASASAETTPVASPTKSSAKGNKGWSMTVKVITWTISIASFVTGIIAVIPILTRDASNLSALYVDVQPYPATSTDWAVPLTADLAAFPAGSGETCNNEQQAWLEQNGTRLTTGIIVDMRNTATEGAMLTVKGFRVAGDRGSQTERAIRVVCDTAPSTTVKVQGARLDAASEDNVAVLTAAAFGSTREGLPDTPVAWNLAPGETGQLIIRLFSPLAVDGQLEATVLNADESRRQEFGKLPLTIRPLIDDGRTYLRAGAALSCIVESDPEPASCVVEDLLAK